MIRPYTSASASVCTIACLVVAIGLSGCGANDTFSSAVGGNPSGSNGGGGGNGGTGGGAGGGATALTWTQRNAVMDATGNMLAKMDPMGDRDAQNVQLATYARTLPGVKDATVDEGRTVTVVFKDDSQYTIVNNLLLTGTRSVPLSSYPSRAVAAQGSMRTNHTGLATHSPTRSRVEGFPDLPQSRKAVVFNAFGPGWDFGNGPSVIQNMLNSGGYEAQMLDPTLENLSALAGAGVIYYNTHGGPITRKKDRLRSFALWTSSHVPDTDAEYSPQVKQWFDDGLIAPMEASWGFQGKLALIHKCWAITQRFIAKYWKLDRNSLVMIDACMSADPLLADVMQGTGTGSPGVCSAYLGWEAYINSSQPAMFLFDRLLGANSYQAEDPKQRPFDLDAVLDDMEARKLDLNGFGTKLQHFKGYLGNFGLLAPTIQNMVMDEGTKTLHIFGEFGDEPSTGGTVTVGGTELKNRTWTPDELFLKNVPDTASGEVVVQVRSHKSNVARLTDWRGKFTYTDTSDGSLKVLGTMNVHLRADMRSYRKKPHEAPDTEPLDFRPVGDSNAVFTASGSNFVPNSGTTTWHGTANLALSLTMGTGFYSRALLDPKAKTFVLALQVSTNDLKYTFTPIMGPSVTGGFFLGLDPLQGPFGLMVDASPSIRPTLGDDFTIGANTVTQQGPGGLGAATLTWDKITPKSAPDPNAAR